MNTKLYGINGKLVPDVEFLNELAYALLKTPGGWGGVCEDLYDIANEIETLRDRLAEYCHDCRTAHEGCACD